MTQTTADPQRSAVFFGPAAAAALLVAVALAIFLRTHGLGIQIVQDDEFHAIHKLMDSGYAAILDSFGRADHSIPLTLLYKALADWVGLDEINMRALQVACGVALVGVAPLIAFRATRDAPAAVLFAFLLAGAPFLVLYSRFARPYAITVLLCGVCIALAWRWRERRTLAGAVAFALTASLSAWLHPLSGLYPAAACLFIAVEDLLRGREERAASLPRSIALGAATALAMIVPLAPALMNDMGSLTGKAGGDYPALHTAWRALSIFSGGLGDAATAVAVALAAFGAWRIGRMNARLVAYLAALALIPAAFIFVVGAAWSQQGHTFARYMMPAQVIYLFLAASGCVALARTLVNRAAAAWTGAALAAGLYLFITPTLWQVMTLREWYGHLYYHYDYGDPRNNAIAAYDHFGVPAFYGKLAAMPAGSAPIIEAPFTYAAPANVFAFFDAHHGQPVKIGMLHDVCLPGPSEDEVPRDPRFRFREFAFLDDPDAIRASGARYLLLYREQLDSKPFAQADHCITELSRRYGMPVEVEPRLAVFDLGPSPMQPKIQ